MIAAVKAKCIESVKTILSLTKISLRKDYPVSIQSTFTDNFTLITRHVQNGETVLSRVQREEFDNHYIFSEMITLLSTGDEVS